MTPTLRSKARLVTPLVLVAIASASTAGEPPTRILLVRHAEKVDASFNPNLTEAGAARAERLAEVAAAAGVSAVYSTEFCRTALTAQPTAHRLGQPLHVDPNSLGTDELAECSPAIDVERIDLQSGIGLEEFADQLLAARRSQTVLVVGHSNTVPALVEELTGVSPCPELIPGLEDGRCFIDDDEYGLRFEVVVPSDGGAATASVAPY